MTDYCWTKLTVLSQIWPQICTYLREILLHFSHRKFIHFMVFMLLEVKCRLYMYMMFESGHFDTNLYVGMTTLMDYDNFFHIQCPQKVLVSFWSLFRFFIFFNLFSLLWILSKIFDFTFISVAICQLQRDVKKLQLNFQIMYFASLWYLNSWNF